MGISCIQRFLLHPSSIFVGTSTSIG
uniref:Uncharacterized protein n=1 Tax=Triticum urartu TaxID=4572 RepID=A0A8R7UPH5_TRIUA